MDSLKDNGVSGTVEPHLEIVSGFVTNDLQYNSFLLSSLSGYANLAQGNVEPIVVSLANMNRGTFVNEVVRESGPLDTEEIEAARNLIRE